MAHQWTDIQRKWIAALRSGEFKQGKKRLSHAGRYCCLGVGCVVLYDGPSDDWNGRDARLPESAREALGLFGEVGDLATGKMKIGTVVANCLSIANDRGATFTEIADFIEAHPEQVFVQPGEDA